MPYTSQLGRRSFAPWPIASLLSRLTLLTLIFLIALAYVWDRSASGEYTVYNSDSFMPFLLVGDLMKDPSALFTWYPSPASFVFPDWLLSALVVATPLPGSWMPLIYGGLIMALYSLAGGALLATTGELRQSHATWMTAALLVSAGLLVLALDGPRTSMRLYVQLGSPHRHTGAVLATLAAAALFLYSLQKSGPPMVAAIVGLAILTFAASFSDLLFSAWFAGPAIITALLYAWTTRQGRGVLLATVLVSTTLSGWAIQSIRSDVGAAYMAEGRGSWSEWAHHLVLSPGVLRESLEMGGHPFDVPMFLVLLATLALLIRGAILSLRLLRRQTPSRGQIMEVLLAGICAAALSAPIAADWVVNNGSLRYFLILMLVPLLWVGYHALKVTAASPLHKLIPMIPVGLIVFGAAMALPAWSSAKRLAAAQPIQVCLEAQGRTAGLGDYWWANKLMLEGDRRIHVAQITSDGAPYRWQTNERWFWSRADNGAPLRPDFIIPWRLNVEALQRSFGPPDRVMNCRGDEVWLYDQPLASFPRRSLRKEGFSDTDLTGVGVLDGTELISNGREGFLLYGPYKPLAAGVYDLRLYGSTTGTGSAWVDIVSDAGQTQHLWLRLQRKEKPDSVLAGGRVTLDKPVYDIEVRVNVGTGDIVRLSGFEMRPLPNQ